MYRLLLISFILISCINKVNESAVQNNSFSDTPVKKGLVIKSGYADSNNIRKFRYYDTTGRLVFVIEWGGIDSSRRMISPVLTGTGFNSSLAGQYIFKEYLQPIYGNENSYRDVIQEYLPNSPEKAFEITDSIVFKNFGFHILSTEFENLLYYLKEPVY